MEDHTGVDVDQTHGTTGQVVVVEGADHHGTPALAVWHLSATAIPVGAWITPRSALAQDPTAADRLLQLTARRALLGWETATARRLLATLTTWAARPTMPEPATVLLPEVLAEIAESRRTYEAAVEEHHRALKTKVSPLQWRHDVPLVESWSEFVAAARLPRPAASCPVATEALYLVRAAAWTVELWHQTETARSRRSYLVDRFGPATGLPAGWLARLRPPRSTSTSEV